jgi:hypothetical protein
VTSIERLPSRLIGLAERIPESLESLAGPAEGRVWLPVRLAWSGPDNYDVSDPGQRLTMYRTLLDCGQRADFVRYVNAALLVHDWPLIRRLTGRRVIEFWEASLPGLAAAA